MNKNVIEDRVSGKNLRDAWQRVKQNKGTAGVDGLTIEDYPVFGYIGTG